VALYRITQEAVNNVRKHAEARRVRVSLRGEEGDEVVLVVEDDGRGFERGATEKAGPRVSFGLRGMAERAALAGGVLTVDSAPGKGTRLEVRIPRQLAGASEDRR